MKRSLYLLIAAVAIMFATTLFTFAQEAEATPDPEIDMISQKYEAEFQKLSESGSDLEKQAPSRSAAVAGFKFDFSKMKRVSLNLPTFTLSRRNFSLGVPEITMKEKKLSWKKPVTTMELRCIAKRPVVKCWPCRTSMQCIYSKVPVITTEVQNTILKIPEFRMVTRNFSLNIPTVSGSKQISFDLPEIRKIDTGEKIDDIEKAASEIESAVKKLEASYQEELNVISSKRLNQNREIIDAEYKKFVSDVTANIDNIRSAGGNPEAITTEQGETINLVEMLATESKKFSDALQTIDTAIKSLKP